MTQQDASPQSDPASANPAHSSEGAAQPNPADAPSPMQPPMAEEEVEALMSQGLDFLRDIPLEITVELGSRRMPLGEVLSLGPNSVIDLHKVSGEPLDVKVNGVLIARGEAVVVNERFGVRLTSVINSSKLLTSIKS